ncbi:MAG: carbohydrate ABC transporter permease [Anaerolineae bacterium]|nr:carbohydrate ABC transporter permease [Anaerolineae bacterium]
MDAAYLAGVSLIAVVWLSPLIEPAGAVLPAIPSLLASASVRRWLGNSVFISTVHTAFQMSVCTSAAYAFARIPFAGKRLVYGIVISGFMIPEQAFFIPIYLMFANLNLHNTYFALIIPGVASPVVLFLLTQFFRGIPTDLDDAAKMDGAGRLLIFLKIILPLSMPVLAVIILYSFLANWNSYLWPLVSATKQDMWTLTIALKKLASTSGLMGGVAAAWLAGAPLILLFFIFQKRIFNGIRFYSGID